MSNTYPIGIRIARLSYPDEIPLANAALRYISKARYFLGLSATVTRKDGHHPIIVMQCGPVRHRVDARSEAAKRPFDHVVRIRDTRRAFPWFESYHAAFLSL